MQDGSISLRRHCYFQIAFFLASSLAKTIWRKVQNRALSRCPGVTESSHESS
jgi:hypothetical protein